MTISVRETGLFLGRHKAMPASKFLKNWANKFSLLCLKMKAFILLFLFCVFLIGFGFSDYYPIIMDGRPSRTEPGRTRTDLDRKDLGSCASPSDNLISLSYSMAAFSANSLGLFFTHIMKS